MAEILKKKRGRKPKSLTNINVVKKYPTDEDIQNTEEEKVILHLPLSMTQINQDDLSVFIENNENDQSSNTINDITDSSNTNSASNSASNNYNNLLNNISQSGKITTNDLKFNKNTKCWWCKYLFDDNPVQLPEDYYNDTFYCIGYFCSFNCAKSFNMDNTNYSLSSKRESLLNLLYYQTYSNHVEITPAPSWLTLKDYGGYLNINEFRKHSVINNKEYLLLQPPITSRQMQIEESYKLKKLNAVPIDAVNKIYSDMESEYSIKRNKIISRDLNLETTMGLIKKKNK